MIGFSLSIKLIASESPSAAPVSVMDLSDRALEAEEWSALRSLIEDKSDNRLSDQIDRNGPNLENLVATRRQNLEKLEVIKNERSRLYGLLRKSEQASSSRRIPENISPELKDYLTIRDRLITDYRKHLRSASGMNASKKSAAISNWEKLNERRFIELEEAYSQLQPPAVSNNSRIPAASLTSAEISQSRLKKDALVADLKAANQ